MSDAIYLVSLNQMTDHSLQTRCKKEGNTTTDMNISTNSKNISPVKTNMNRTHARA